VLVVDDNADAAEMLGEMLALSGYQVRIETDARQTVTAAEAFRPHVAILDLGMPDMSGFEVAAQLRSALSSPPALIALTGYGQPSDRRRTQAAGFFAHLVKPVDIRALLDLLGPLARGSAESSEAR
jgi:CheY-like chemotaxis protein